MFKTVTDIVLFIVAVFAVIGGIYKAYIVLHKKWLVSRKKKDSFFSGSWSNEGNIIKNRPTHYVDLTLYCGGKKLHGSFNIRKSDDPNGWVKVSLSGRRRSYLAKCNVTQSINSELINDGKIVLSKNKDRNLEWRLLNGSKDFFPVTATLNRSFPVVV